MGTIADKLNYLSGTKDYLRRVVLDKGIEIPDDATFRELVELAEGISVADPTAFNSGIISSHDGIVLLKGVVMTDMPNYNGEVIASEDGIVIDDGVVITNIPEIIYEKEESE